jgi:hypothetical protein
LPFLDDHSRYALSVTYHQPVSGPAVVAAFQQAVADQGIPASVLLLNGVVFTTRFAGGCAGRDTLPASRSRSRAMNASNLGDVNLTFVPTRARFFEYAPLCTCCPSLLLGHTE